jgi:hypothetical protein
MRMPPVLMPLKHGLRKHPSRMREEDSLMISILIDTTMLKQLRLVLFHLRRPNLTDI